MSINKSLEVFLENLSTGDMPEEGLEAAQMFQEAFNGNKSVVVSEDEASAILESLEDLEAKIKFIRENTRIQTEGFDEVLTEGVIRQIFGDAFMDGGAVASLNNRIADIVITGQSIGKMTSLVKSVSDDVQSYIDKEIKDRGIKLTDELPESARDSWLATGGNNSKVISELLTVIVIHKAELIAKIKGGDKGLTARGFMKGFKENLLGSEIRKYMVDNVKTYGDLKKFVSTYEKNSIEILKEVEKQSKGEPSKWKGSHHMVTNSVVSITSFVRSVLRRAR